MIAKCVFQIEKERKKERKKDLRKFPNGFSDWSLEKQ